MAPRKPMSELTYASKHDRIRRLHGSASEYACSAACGAAGAHWACVGDYDTEDDYIPLCIPCHKRFDLERIGFEYEPHGTQAAYGRHVRLGEMVCEKCRTGKQERYAEAVLKNEGRVVKGRRGRFSDDEIRSIRRAVADGMTHREVAATYGVDHSCIGGIARRDTYKEVL